MTYHCFLGIAIKTSMPMTQHFIFIAKTNLLLQIIYNQTSMKRNNIANVTKFIFIIKKKTTSYITLGSRYRLNGSHLLTSDADNIRIKQVFDQKLLGLHIGENLNWCSRIDQLCKTSKSSLYCDNCLTMPPFTSRNYSARVIFFFPSLDYGSVIWGSSSAINIE